MEIAELYLRTNEEIKLRDEYSTFTVKRVSIGKLNILSGKIVACDPFMISDYDLAFHQEIPNGVYEVDLIIAKNDVDDERVAMAIANFSSLTPERWILATRGNQKLDELPEGRIYGYGVDSGTGSFLDLESAKTLVHNFMTNDKYFDELNDNFGKNYIHTRSWVIYEADPEKKLNVAMFSSGYGDGFYPSYWGYASDNSVVCLVTDFGVLGNAELIE